MTTPPESVGIVDDYTPSLTPNDEIHGELKTDTDTNVFPFEASHEKTYHFRITDEFHTSHLVEILNDRGDTVAERINRWHGDQAHLCSNRYSFLNQIRWQPKLSGNYYLKISANPFGYPVNGKYSFVMEEHGAFDDHPDHESKATRIQVGQKIDGIIEWGPDIDQFRFIADPDQTYTIEVETQNGQEINFDVRDAAGKPLTIAPSHPRFSVERLPPDDRNRPPSDLSIIGPICNSFDVPTPEYADELTFESRRPEEYFISISRSGTKFPVPYTLSVETTHQRDEVGETPEHATEIQINELVESDIGLQNDADLFRFQADTGREYQMDFSINGTWNPKIAILYLGLDQTTLHGYFSEQRNYWDFSQYDDDNVNRKLSGRFTAVSSGETYLIVMGPLDLPEDGSYKFTVKHK